MNSQEPCGEGAFQALLRFAGLKGGKAPPAVEPDPADGRNPKDVETDAPATAAAVPPVANFTASDRKVMLELARHILRCVVSHSGQMPEVYVKDYDYAPRLTEKRACFVTLTKEGELRGCVGHIHAREPLCQAVASSARNAALADPRFPPLAPDEVELVKIEISVLTEPQPLSFTSPEDLLSKLHPPEDGVLLWIGRHMATFLPQVWERVPDTVEFLNHLAQKAGCAPSAWRDKGSAVSIYHVESFEEN
jgi:AmmeMemoRadiSam system protein A